MSDVDNIVLEQLRHLRDNDRKTHAELADIKHHICELHQIILKST